MGKIYKKNLADACEEYSKIFGANKNLYRIMPRMQDGLKPVQERFLYTLYKGKGRNQFIKMAKAAADTTASYHPHGSASVEDVGAKMASPIANNIVTVDGQGNFGSYKDDKAAAARYIECKLSKYALKCFFEDFEDSNVDMKLAYTGDEEEPEFLPARYPHALFNPQLSGIGYAFASNIPPFNIKEVLNATIKLIKDPNSKIIIAPDSPTGADVIDDGQFETICEIGVGTFTLRGSIEVDEIKNTITITSIPLQITIDNIIKNIVELRNKKVFNEIKDIKDYSGEHHVKTIIYLDQSANPYKTVEKLYKKGTGLKKTYPVGIKMIDNYRDFDYGVKSFLLSWIDYRRDTVRSSFNTRLVKAMEEQNINDIMIFVLNANNAEKTIKMAKEANNRQSFAKDLMDKYGIDSQQANTIANMRIYAFSKESYEGYKDKKIELANKINELESILDDDDKIDEVIINQLKEGIELFGSKRKSKIVKIEEENEIADSDHIVALSKDGYIKKVDKSLSKIGQVGNTTGQYMTIGANNRESLLVFDSTGTISKIPVNEIPDMELEDSGILLERYFKVKGNVVAVLIEPTEAEIKKRGKDLFMVFLTKLGFVKRVLLSEFSNVNGSTLAIKLPNNDELVGVEFASDETIKDMVIYTNLGNGIRRDINEFSIMKANARGVKQLDVSENEYCVGFDKISPTRKYLLFVTSAGRIKITEEKYLPTMKRKDEILSLINLEKNETLIGIRSVSKTDQVIIYKKNSQPEVVDLKDLKVSTRIAKAEKLIKTPKGESVLSFTVIR